MPPAMSKKMLSPPPSMLDWVIAARSEPVPLSALVVTRRVWLSSSRFSSTSRKGTKRRGRTSAGLRDDLRMPNQRLNNIDAVLQGCAGPIQARLIWEP